jgi:hypothetical protein
VPMLQTILTTGPGHQTSQITCILIKAGMFTSAIRMAITKTGRTGSNLLPVNDLLPASSQAPDRVRGKTTSGSKWTGHIRTEARERKITTVHSNTSNKTGADQPVQADQAEPARAEQGLVEEEEGKIKIGLA